MTEATVVNSFAVAGADGVYLSSGQRLALPTFQQLGYWLDAMTRRHIDTLWLHPSAGWRWLDADIDTCDPWLVAGGARSDEGDPYWTATYPDRYGVRQIVQPIYEDRAPWREAASAEDLRAALLRFRAAIGFDWWRGPGGNGTRLLRQLHSGPHATKLELPGDPPPVARDGSVRDGGHLAWVRALAPEERCGYLHSYDVNAQYLSAANGLALGVDGWQHHSRVTLPEKPSQWLAGYYRVTLTRRAEEAVTAPCPPIINNGPAWVTTPTLRLLREQGSHFRITEAYTWAASKRYLDPWYKALRDARARLAPDSLELDALKGLYKHPITWFASEKWSRAGDALYRPDWFHQLTAQARAGVLRTVYRVGVNFGVWPVAVGSDCVYYITASPEPVGPLAPFVTVTCGDGPLPSDGVRLSPSVGHFKVKDQGVPVGEIAALLRGPRWSLHQLQIELNRRAGCRQAEVA